MIDREFTGDFTHSECPKLPKGSIDGIWRRNKVKRMITQHKTHR